MTLTQPAQVMQLRAQRRGDQPQVDIDRRLGGACQEHRAAVADLGHRRIQILRSVVHTVAAVGKT
jgi:hypothetical protein